MIGVFCMTKYNYSFKLQVVKSYLNGEGGYKHVAAKYNIPNESQVRRWVNLYTTFGEDVLERKNNFII
ncbi:MULTISPECIES: helix-turn-helix domain-containing protein [Terrisporobacter]